MGNCSLFFLGDRVIKVKAVTVGAARAATTSTVRVSQGTDLRARNKGTADMVRAAGSTIAARGMRDLKVNQGTHFNLPSQDVFATNFQFNPRMLSIHIKTIEQS